MSKVANLWGWTIAAATGMAIVYGLDLSSAEFFRKKLSMAENIIYGGFHRLAWAIAVSWVIFACSRGYGGLLILYSISIKLFDRGCLFLWAFAVVLVLDPRQKPREKDSIS